LSSDGTASTNRRRTGGAISVRVCAPDSKAIEKRGSEASQQPAGAQAQSTRGEGRAMACPLEPIASTGQLFCAWLWPPRHRLVRACLLNCRP
jgi:hypothetical protein